jgi:hypothetical protein
VLADCARIARRLESLLRHWVWPPQIFVPWELVISLAWQELGGGGMEETFEHLEVEQQPVASCTERRRRRGFEGVDGRLAVPDLTKHVGIRR